MKKIKLFKILFYNSNGEISEFSNQFYKVSFIFESIYNSDERINKKIDTFLLSFKDINYYRKFELQHYDEIQIKGKNIYKDFMINYSEFEKMSSENKDLFVIEHIENTLNLYSIKKKKDEFNVKEVIDELKLKVLKKYFTFFTQNINYNGKVLKVHINFSWSNSHYEINIMLYQESKLVIKRKILSISKNMDIFLNSISNITIKDNLIYIVGKKNFDGFPIAIEINLE